MKHYSVIIRGIVQMENYVVIAFKPCVGWALNLKVILLKDLKDLNMGSLIEQIYSRLNVRSDEDLF